MLGIEDINKLEKENELITKQYNSLLNKYNEVLKLAKENADSNEFCLQELEEKYANLKGDFERLEADYQRVVSRNKELQKEVNDLEEMYGLHG